MIEVSHFARIDKNAPLPVCDKCAVVPAVPQPAHDIDELSGNFIPEIMVFKSILAKVQGGRIHRAGDHIPGGSPVAHVID